jgi:hypothetical protein
MLVKERELEIFGSLEIRLCASSALRLATELI